jgi:hypothetical protein
MNCGTFCFIHLFSVSIFFMEDCIREITETGETQLDPLKLKVLLLLFLIIQVFIL